MLGGAGLHVLGRAEYSCDGGQGPRTPVPEAKHTGAVSAQDGGGPLKLPDHVRKASAR